MNYDVEYDGDLLNEVLEKSFRFGNLTEAEQTSWMIPAMKVLRMQRVKNRWRENIWINLERRVRALVLEARKNI